MNWKNKKGYKIKIDFMDLGEIMDRGAIFVFKTPGGIATVETSYLDPWNSGKSGFEFDGPISETETAAMIKTERGEVRIEEAKDSEIENSFTLVAGEARTDYKTEYTRLKKTYILKARITY